MSRKKNMKRKQRQGAPTNLKGGVADSSVSLASWYDQQWNAVASASSQAIDEYYRSIGKRAD